LYLFFTLELCVAVIHAGSSAEDVRAWLATTFPRAVEKRPAVWERLLELEPTGKMLLRYKESQLEKFCGDWGIDVYNELHPEQQGMSILALGVHCLSFLSLQ
jgi:hypothetical protein